MIGGGANVKPWEEKGHSFTYLISYLIAKLFVEKLLAWPRSANRAQEPEGARSPQCSAGTLRFTAEQFHSKNTYAQKRRSVQSRAVQ